MNHGNKYLIFVKIILIFLAILTLIFFLAKDLAWNGKLQMHTDFTRFTPFFSILKPQDRILIKDMAYIQAEPAYFDLYLPRDFDKAVLQIEYKNEFDYPIKIGPNVGQDWELKPLEGDLPADENGFTIKSVEFDLAGKNINNGKLRFIISLPGLLDSDKGVYVKNLQITLFRQPIWQENLIDNLLAYLKYAKNQF